MNHEPSGREMPEGVGVPNDSPMMSVIIPACNEGSVINRALRAITGGATLAELEVIVVCNGCTDDTVIRAREFDFPLRVIETEIASKTHALNLGDKAASFFPRFYVDADVLVTIHVLRALANRLQRGDVHAVAPRPCFNLVPSSRFVKAYYDIRARLPSGCEGIGGSGVYGLSEAGRSRFKEFPRVIADDAFVRIQFRLEERETIASLSSIVYPPHSISDLLAIRTRAYYGNRELSRRYPDLWINKGTSNGKALMKNLWKLSLWPGILIYLGVNILARARANRSRHHSTFVWRRDNTSRSASESCSSESCRERAIG